MSTTTSIEWATKTWGPVLGCKKVSAGCDNCYAIRTSHRLAHLPHTRDLYAGLTQRTEDGPAGPGRLDWTGVVRTVPERLRDPLAWRKPERIFVNSQSDLFHPAVGADFTARIFATMAATRWHTYQVLTKRPDVAVKVLRDPEFQDLMAQAYLREIPREHRPNMIEWPLPNVWIGVSVEDQATADDRIPKLMRIPAAVRWISAEPLLGPIQFTRLHVHCPVHDFPGGFCSSPCPQALFLDWVVLGGESGPGARPMHPDWARSLRDQCAEAEVPLLLKQRGAWTWDQQDGQRHADRQPDGYLNVEGLLVDEATALSQWGSWQGVWRVGKTAAGRELDGVVHDAFPPETGVPS